MSEVGETIFNGKTQQNAVGDFLEQIQCSAQRHFSRIAFMELDLPRNELGVDVAWNKAGQHRLILQSAGGITHIELVWVDKKTTSAWVLQSK